MNEVTRTDKYHQIDKTSTETNNSMSKYTKQDINNTLLINIDYQINY